MEGVVDHAVRALITQFGGFDLCVTEFLRVSQTLLPERSFYRLAPELNWNHGKTASGTPVRVQLLGNAAPWLAENAHRAIELGSHGIDLNFGCPAKTVNNSKGGAALLQEPETLYSIVRAVRSAVDSQHIVSAKIRLGFNDISLLSENIQAIYEAGASELAIHARSKKDGYKPPAYWPKIKPYISQYDMPIIANGEIWTPQDASLCIQQSGSKRLMLGRGALAMPNLANMVKHQQSAFTWPQVIKLLLQYSEFEIEGDRGLYYGNRIKQWLRYLKIHFPQVTSLAQEIRQLHKKSEIVAILQSKLEAA
ncbi:tRNA-dihydrouridine synthase [Catenovulum sediminis]|uniref:tRNA-dihydrouridine synthase n=1 Tax=Catenovulum sediminis TaxID=1740262 RepID=UPI001180D4AA|nr:tRNA-dihydrouridine synthase [Catenovulum sediminis]